MSPEGEEGVPKEDSTAKTVLSLVRENRQIAIQIRERLQPSEEAKKAEKRPPPKHLLFKVQDIIEDSNSILREVRNWLRILGK